MNVGLILESAEVITMLDQSNLKISFDIKNTENETVVHFCVNVFAVWPFVRLTNNEEASITQGFWN